MIHLDGFAGELMEEQLGHGGYAGIRVPQAQGQACHMAADLHHVIQNEVRQHHQAILYDTCTACLFSSPPDPRCCSLCHVVGREIGQRNCQRS